MLLLEPEDLLCERNQDDCPEEWEEWWEWDEEGEGLRGIRYCKISLILLESYIKRCDGVVVVGIIRSLYNVNIHTLHRRKTDTTHERTSRVKYSLGALGLFAQRNRQARIHRIKEFMMLSKQEVCAWASPAPMEAGPSVV